LATNKILNRLKEHQVKYSNCNLIFLERIYNSTHQFYSLFDFFIILLKNALFHLTVNNVLLIICGFYLLQVYLCDILQENDNGVNDVQDCDVNDHDDELIHDDERYGENVLNIKAHLFFQFIFN
jgi:hypothetical protein